MAISFRASSTDTAVAESSLVVTKPTGTVEDDVMVAVLSVKGTAGGDDITVTPPAGWTAIDGEYDDSTPGVRGQAYYKVAGASEGADYTFTLSAATDACAAILTYDGVDTVTPIHQHAIRTEPSVASTTRTTPNITTTNTAWIISYFGDRSGSSYTGPDTERIDIRANSLASLCVSDSNADVSPATLSRTATATASSSTRFEGIIALNPYTVAAPAVTVEIAFNASYSTAAASRTWTNVTPYVLTDSKIGITRGRQDELSDIDASQLSLTFDNSDGRFTAGLATGAYYPNVKVGRPIRVTVTPSGGTASTRFLGYVDAWPVEWPGVVGSFATAAITATSRQARLSLNNERLSTLEEEITLDDPSAWYKLGEPEGSVTAADSSTNARDPLTTLGTGASVIFGSATGPSADDLTAAQFAGGKYLGGLDDPSGVGSDFYAIEFFFLRSAAPSSAECMVTRWRHALNCATVAMNTSGQVEVRISGAVEVNSSASFADGGTHHVVYIGRAVGTDTHRLYVDGVEVDTAAAGGLGGTNGAALSVGGGDPALTNFSGVVAHVATYYNASTDPLSAARIAVHSAAGLDGLDGDDTSDEWIARLAGWDGIPTAEQSLDVGEAVISGLRAHGQTVIDLMQKVTVTENGLIYDARDGTLRFRNRSHRYNQTSAFTLDTAANAASEVEADYAAVLDRQSMINDATATSADDSVASARVINQSSVDEYGNAREQIELATGSAAELTAAAGWAVNTYAQPRIRVPTVSVELAKLSVARQAFVLAADISTRFTVTNAPDNAPAVTADYVVEGYEEQIGGGLHTITFNVSDATTWDVFQLDSATLGVLDEDRLAW